MSNNHSDTITSVVTATGAGVGIIRLSGPEALIIAKKITNKSLKPRYAHYLPFYDQNQQILDQGICIYFPGPHSLTGEDVIELQGHGGSIILDMLLKLTLELGARQARAGEYLERAFLNDKIDLAQAEATADLIEATTAQAALSAVRSLSGEFSKQINDLLHSLIHLRMYVESSIDFPEEEIDFLSDGIVENKTKKIIEQLENILSIAQQGVLLKEGISFAIIGQPNAGKSSLLNKLSGEETAIVTDIAGTTRDIVKQEINLDGLPLHLIDTAGLRESDCEVEKIGIERAWKAVENVDHVFMLIDSNKGFDQQDKIILEQLNQHTNKITIVFNKIDLLNQKANIEENKANTEVYLSIKKNQGIDLLKDHLKKVIGYQNQTEGIFSARRRHIEALEQALESTKKGLEQLLIYQAGELLAEELSIAQQFLSEITGEFTSDDLLGKIFSDFCIGK
ncbi:MAG: tRNA uridine-5-carboxymethylaminomethyl(34) synthesis GTPase MnmE [Gammaproteobacteria bacterium]|nr:tRNA uridine-5-carboxymethylaminomethyl(34) synthesis GTPase MnmE [Gammaproteobacteria bacterium]